MHAGELFTRVLLGNVQVGKVNEDIHFIAVMLVRSYEIMKPGRM